METGKDEKENGTVLCRKQGKMGKTEKVLHPRSVKEDTPCPEGVKDGEGSRS